MGFGDHADRHAEGKIQGFVTRSKEKKARLVSGKQSQYRAVGENYSDERGRRLSCQLAVEGRREREEGKKKKKKKISKMMTIFNINNNDNEEEEEEEEEEEPQPRQKNSQCA
jgi:uncharacterized 2Fe-2S/4Fe-4S cluster protein (DUF4445 family)